VDAALADIRDARHRLPALGISGLRNAVMLGLSDDEAKAAGWTYESLGELGVWAGGATPSMGNPVYWTGGTIPWVTSKDMKRLVIADTIDHVTRSGVDGSSCRLIPAPSLLFVMRSGILQHTLPVALTSDTVTVNQDLKALTPRPGLDAEYLLFCILARREQIRRRCMKDGTTVQSIEFEALKNYKIPLPPTVDEQVQAASRAKLALEVSSILRDAVTDLARSAVALRQSILKAAFSGQLI
jgi:type I restriction enzyme S subunit